MKKKKVVCIFLILICSVLAIIIFCHYKYKNESETEIRVISQRHGVLTGAYEYDGELYRSTSNGIYKYVENSEKVEVIKVDSDYFNFTISNEKIYIVSSDETNAFLSIYSMSGNLLDKQELPVEYLSGIGIVDNYLIGDISTEKGKYIFKVFDIENELTEVDIKLTECIYYSKTHYSCGEEYILAALDDKSYFICNNGYIKSSSEEYLAAEKAAMTNLVLRCEDGAFELDNFKFSVMTVQVDSTTEINIPKGQQAVYTAEVEYSGSGKVVLKCGGTELFYIENGSLKVGGKAVEGSYKAGTYHIESVISPDQEMQTVEVVAPGGEVVRRGFYTLLGGGAINCFVTGESKVIASDVKYESCSVNEYTLTTQEPIYTGVDAKIYNLVTSFDEAQTTRNFAWTAKSAFIGKDPMALKYRKAGEADWITVDAVRETERVNIAGEDYFKCDLSSLAPDTEYEYKIGKKDGDEDADWTKIFKFKTAKESIDEFTFVAVGDTQGVTWNGLTSSDKGVMFAMAAYQEAFEEVKDPAFILHTGDVVETGNNKNMWNMYFKALNGFGASTPMFAAIGNHDSWGTPLCFDLHFNHPNNGGAAALDQSFKSKVTDGNVLQLFDNADETIYSYDYGNAHFIVLNTGSYCNQDKHIIDAQREWLTNDLEANKEAKWKIMLFHEPVYHRAGAGESRPWLHDVIEEYGVDLVLQGHSHLVTRTYPMKDGKIVTKAVDERIEKGIGTVYTTIGSTALNHDGANDGKYEEEIGFLVTPTPTQPAYTTVTVQNDKIVVTTKQINGFVLDSFTIEDKNISDDTTPDESDDVSDESSEASSESTEITVPETESSAGSAITDPENETSGSTVIVVICSVALIVLGVGIVLILKRRK